MTGIHRPLSRLGLAQYVQTFTDEGFDSWETILHITESDLDHLGVKLGHRRVLQREIAYARGVSVEHLSSPTRTHQGEDARGGGSQDGLKQDGQLDSAPRGKRKYRRHPKNDENAPERPPSAYVIFSNKIREELKPQNLSFTEIAKRVGERWQVLTPDEKGPHEKVALAMKEKFHVEMNAYKLTETYRTYMEYLAEFKVKNASAADGKRPKLEPEESKETSASLGGPDSIDCLHSTIGSEHRRRVDSMSSVGPFQMTGGLPSPASTTGRPFGVRGGLASIASQNNVSHSPSSTSPSSPSNRRDSSLGPMPATALHPRPYTNPNADPSYSGRSQRLHQNSPYELLDGPSTRSPSSGPQNDSGPSRSREGHFDERRHIARPPQLIHQNTSGSSNMSVGSGLSNSSTAASSLNPASSAEEDGSGRPHLPPLSATGLKPNGPISDYALRPSQGSLPSENAPPSANHSPYRHQSPHNGSSSSSGMAFESLQLPLPYNVAFGSRPLPRPDNEGNLANIFDLQDMPTRTSLRSLTLQQNASDARNAAPLGQNKETRGSPLPPFHPMLPSLRPGVSAMLRQDLPFDPASRPEEDRLAVLADVAQTDHDRRET